MLGERIKEMRAVKKMKQVELAKKLSISKQALSNWENDNILPSIDMLRRLATYLSCSTDYLLELDTSRKILDVSDLTMEQTAHLQTIINDLRKMNRALKGEDSEEPEEPSLFKISD